MTCLVHMYSYLGGNSRLTDFYQLHHYHVINRFGDIRINEEKRGRNVKPGHRERAMKNMSLLRKSGGLASVLQIPP